jgi:hypothetical protein
MKDEQLLSAARAAVVMYTLLVSREGLSQKKKEELKTTYLRNQGWKLVSAFDLFQHQDGRKVVKEQSLIECYKDAINPISDEIIKEMQHREKELLGLLPAEGGSKC